MVTARFTCRIGRMGIVFRRPNAGKSSIVNAFIGEERNIVTEIAVRTAGEAERRTPEK